jgi:ribA/ribD-fused uncharacterized protein
MTLTGVVKEFKGDYHFLSNFYPGRFMWRNVEFPTGEHAFSYAKGYFAPNYTGPQQQSYFDRVLNAPTPGKAKYQGRSVPLDVAEWDKRKVQYMREIVHARFAQDLSGQALAGRLVNTGAMMLVEGNDWNDTFWGRCNGKGFNTLGVILMEERGYWLRGNFDDEAKAASDFVPAWAEE